ncbi:hypothetical protein, partial [Algoriphagus sp.]|uniref:hypothetical protein n=1 Tax=Algoriphagus sp. TaxID=1872435 RepID=UPI003F6EB20C
NQACEGTLTTQKHSGLEGSACSGISICESIIGLEILNNINPTRKAVSETLTGQRKARGGIIYRVENLKK